MTAEEKADAAAETAAQDEDDPVAESIDDAAPEDPTADEQIADADDAVTALQVALEERTADLQRLTAEYQNYRKRVERDRAVAAEQATVSVVAGLVPILDDVDRAREHGDLVGPFASVTEQLHNTLTKLGLESFGEKGDPFDPTLHEAVAHMRSAEVSETSCIDVMRRGYRIGERLVRPAMVAVAEPSDDAEPSAPSDDESPEADESLTEDVAGHTDAEAISESDADSTESAEESTAPADAEGTDSKSVAGEPKPAGKTESDRQVDSAGEAPAAKKKNRK